MGEQMREQEDVQDGAQDGELEGVASPGAVAASVLREVIVERTSQGRFDVTNSRGGRITIGAGGDEAFTPTELLLAAIGGCSAIDVDILTSRRSEPDEFAIVVDANKVRDSQGNRLADIEVIFRICFPEGSDGDAARALLPNAVKVSHERLCTVGRTVEIGTPISTLID